MRYGSWTTNPLDVPLRAGAWSSGADWSKPISLIFLFPLLAGAGPLSRAGGRRLV